MVHIHILGACGTFMGGIARIAASMRHRVTGSDANIYPPMSTQLAALGIELFEGYAAEHLQPAPDCVIVGNAMSRGNPAVEYLLDSGIPFFSGPEWLYRHVLRNRWVLACAGTHGKTTTSSMLAWILEYADLSPSFLIGGVPCNFGISARLLDTPFFVIEADEYDSAFFDKRAKFMHYRPRTLVLGNLEFDHADIYDDLLAVRRQFSHLVRTVPASGRIIHNSSDSNLRELLAQGCWSGRESFSLEDADWSARQESSDGSVFSVLYRGETLGTVEWDIWGQHNVQNALCAMAAAAHAGVEPALAIAALSRFESVERRMRLHSKVNGRMIYDDFAHHPTAIQYTLGGLRRRVGNDRITAVVELRSFTMRSGVHLRALKTCFEGADQVYLLKPAGANWDVESLESCSTVPTTVLSDIDGLIKQVAKQSRLGDHLVVMSNGHFHDCHNRLSQAIANLDISGGSISEAV